MKWSTIPISQLGATDLRVSRLGLGTAEIGFAYGLEDPHLPSEDEAIVLLNTAVELGVTFFDTANYYGVAEERIGKSGILKNPDVIICTKCAQFLEKGEYFEARELERRIRDQVEGSLRNLNIDTLPLLLLHGPSKEQLEEGTLLAIVDALKTEGKIRFAGASTRGFEAPMALLRSGKADVLQVAFSIADRRMAANIFPLAMEHHIGIINRSAYLKGAFAGKRLPPGLEHLIKVVDEADNIARELGISLPALALRYTLSERAIGTTLIGTTSLTHLKEAIEVIKQGPLPLEVVARLQTLAIEDQDQVDPARWSRVPH